jgi:hypothetical protein
MIAKYLLLGNSRFQFQKFLKSGFLDVFASQRLCRYPPGPSTTAITMSGINTITVIAERLLMASLNQVKETGSG